MVLEGLEDSISSWAEAYRETEEDRLGDLLHEEKPTAGDDMKGRKETQQPTGCYRYRYAMGRCQIR